MMYALLLLLCSLHSAQASEDIAILRSDDLAEYQVPIDAFVQDLTIPYRIYKLNGNADRAERVGDKLAQDPPSLIFALGAKAAWTAHNSMPNTPLIYAMVHDPDRYGIDGINVTGIRVEVPPQKVIAQFQLFAPDVKTIGIIISQNNSLSSVAEAVSAAEEAGYEVIARRTANPRDVRRVFIQLRSRIDALWIIPDSEVVSPNNFHFIRSEANRTRLPILAYSEALVHAGALLCVAADLTDIGHQAATLVPTILSGTNAGSIPPLEPEGTRVLFNKDTSQIIGLRFDDLLLDFVDEVIDEPTSR